MASRYPTLSTLCCLALCLSALAAPANAQELERHAIYDRAVPASYDMIIEGIHAGSAIAVDPSGLVLTASHAMLGNPQSLELVGHDGSRQDAEVVAIDLRHDLALLQLPAREGGYPTVPLAQESPQAGDELLLFGSPMFRPNIMQRGMLAHDGTAYEYYENLNAYVELQYVSGSAQPGTSGGAWINARGELVGIQLSIMSNNGTCVGVSMMAPLAALRQMVEHREFVPIPTLGAAYEHLWEHPPEVTSRYPSGMQGVVLRRVEGHSTVAGAGLGEWDLITAANGHPLQRPNDLAAILAVQESDSSLTLTVLSPGDDEPREVEVPMTWLQLNWNTLAPTPDDASGHDHAEDSTDDHANDNANRNRPN